MSHPSCREESFDQASGPHNFCADGSSLRSAGITLNASGTDLSIPHEKLSLMRNNNNVIN